MQLEYAKNGHQRTFKIPSSLYNYASKKFMGKDQNKYGILFKRIIRATRTRL